MAIALNKKKNFSKTASEAVLKAQDETVQITRDEWEAMQESLSQLQNFMNDLVEGNLEIEIIDEGEEKAEKAEEAQEAEEMAEEGKEEEADMQEVEVPEEMEEVEAEAEEEEEEKAKDAKHSEDGMHSKDAKHSEEEKAKDAELEAVLQDPAKRKAVFDFLKATDSRSPFQGITMNAVKKRIGRALAKTDSSLPSRKRALDSIMKQILAERDNGSVIESVIVNKAVDTTLTKLADGYHKEAEDGYGQMYDGEGKEMSIEQFVQSRVKPGMKDSELDGIVEMICEKYPECKISKAIAMVREAQKGMKSRDAKKAKKVIKRKTLSKAADSLVPDFTSRFLEETRKPKAQDKAKDSKDLSREFSGRFE